MANVKKCTFCAETGHTQFYCTKKPRKMLSKEAPKTRAMREEVSRRWFEKNPPDAYGDWKCYLGISTKCFKKVNRGNINLEHVKSKARHPGHKYNIKNLKPACPPCNKLKGSLDIEELKYA